MRRFDTLPAEIILQILLNLDPSSFFICLQTSRLFREHALASKTLLRRHLARIPGRRRNTRNNSTSLLRLFGWRASLHLFNGAERMADVHIWRASPHMDRKASRIAVIPQVEGDRPDPTLKFIEVHSGLGLVNIYAIDDSGLKLESVISPEMLTSHLPAYEKAAEFLGAGYRVLKVAAESHSDREDGQLTLAVLYVPKCSLPGVPNKGMKVICFRLDSEHGPIIEKMYQLGISTDDNSTVIDMALDGQDGDPIILYHSHTNTRDRLPPHLYRITTYRRAYDELTCKWNTEDTTQALLLAREEEEEHPIGALLVQGENLHLCPAAFPIPYWTSVSMRYTPLTPEEYFERRDTYLPDVVEAFPKQSIGRVIASFHHHQITDKDLNDGAPTCVNTALELVLSPAAPFDSPFGMRSRHGIFLLKAIHYPDSCAHFDTTTDYPSLQHVFVAHLPGLPLANLSTIGVKIAVSPRAHRIAVAHWRTLLVYALHPDAFLDPEYALAGGRGVPGDYAFIEGCGWEYYRNGDFERECVVLPPVELECKGVVFGLQWRDESELWGWTEEGVVRWRMGVGMTGARGCEELAAVPLAGEGLRSRACG